MNSFDVEFCNKEFTFIEYINVCEADLYAAIKIFVSQVHYQGQSKVMFKLPHPLNFNIIIIITRMGWCPRTGVRAAQFANLQRIEFTKSNPPLKLKQ